MLVVVLTSRQVISRSEGGGITYKFLHQAPTKPPHITNTMNANQHVTFTDTEKKTEQNDSNSVGYDGAAWQFCAFTVGYHTGIILPFSCM